MSSNKSARQELERLFGKKCMIEELGIRYIPKEERRKIKGYTKYDECLTYHHIKERHNGGKATVENGALVRGYNHRWLHSLPDETKEKINNCMQEFKANILQQTGARTEPSQDVISEASKVSLPEFDTDTEVKKKKFNRAKEKAKFRRMVDEILGEDEEDLDDYYR